VQHFENGDLVLLINSIYNPEIIGHIGIVECRESQITGYDRFGGLISGNYVVVDLANDINRHGTTLWYLKPEHLKKINPGNAIKLSVTNALISV
jgi:hypothetical protein